MMQGAIPNVQKLTTRLSKTGYRKQLVYVPWWRPVRLVQQTDEGFKPIGWLWRQPALVTNNMHEGFAFLDDQTPQNLAQCPWCKQHLSGSVVKITPTTKLTND